jgi:hypothetical protein
MSLAADSPWPRRADEALWRIAAALEQTDPAPAVR